MHAFDYIYLHIVIVLSYAMQLLSMFNKEAYDQQMQNTLFQDFDKECSQNKICSDEKFPETFHCIF